MPFRKTCNSCGHIFDAAPWSEPQSISDASGFCQVKDISCHDISVQQLDSSVVTAHSLVSSGQIIEPELDPSTLITPSPDVVLESVLSSLPDVE